MDTRLSQAEFSCPPVYQGLCRRLGLDLGIPYTEHWSAGADFLELLVDQCLAQRPRTILECSSGLTTLVLARCCRLNGLGRVYSLEDGAPYAEATRQALVRYGLADLASVLHAPLTGHRLGDRTFQWYRIDALPAMAAELLVIDGPSGFIQRHSRYPALPVLRHRLAPRCTLMLDDADRPDERELVARWRAEVPHMEYRHAATERGCVVLTLPDTP